VDGKLQGVEVVRGRTALVRQGVRQVQKRERQLEEAREEAERAELLKAAEAAAAKVTLTQPSLQHQRFHEGASDSAESNCYVNSLLIYGWQERAPEWALRTHRKC
jgi:hypothetical protein